MKDTCTRENRRDFRQRYQGTMGWLIKESGEQELVYIDNVDDAYTSFIDNSGQRCVAKHNMGVEFSFTQLERGWFNSPRYPVFISRIPARQWQRGICAANTSMRFPYKDSLAAIDVTIESVGECLMATSSETKKPVVLSKFFCVYEGKVWFLDKQIGQEKDGTITLDDDTYRQELSDTINRNQYLWKIA
jgi:hypothetical protein